ncbi:MULTISPECIES: A24 family peptidase [unclassified Pseudodesulfovibrio]|uniref:A24 family peptidase n=1 Tax=unclassified Pseudodesulfovibrio TaxID=2661612 RepID=UPI000FEBD0BD|nr:MULTISPECIES: A24 family peptidase [unclassified Pseudodesulfovibrio]MCJ2164423.1 A24 family peptidase [Pseudodesulfovibrio sp. S3-i]RWU04629.1 prepilin peptidase [Pseudodesulfovibrio sp. S3]
MDILVTIVLAVALITATITDIRCQRIYNWLTFPLILAGFATHTVFGGLEGLKFAASGFALGFIAMAIPYFMGVMGAGDVKLMAGVGAWLGLEATFTAFLFTSMAGGIYALGVLAFNRQVLKAVLHNIAGTFYVFMATRKFDFDPVTTEKVIPRLCYGVAIAVGTALAMGMYAWQTGSIHSGY